MENSHGKRKSNRKCSKSAEGKNGRESTVTKGLKSARTLRRRNVNCNRSAESHQGRHSQTRGTNLIQLIGKTLEIGARPTLFRISKRFRDGD